MSKYVSGFEQPAWLKFHQGHDAAVIGRKDTAYFFFYFITKHDDRAVGYCRQGGADKDKIDSFDKFDTAIGQVGLMAKGIAIGIVGIAFGIFIPNVGKKGVDNHTVGSTRRGDRIKIADHYYWCDFGSECCKQLCRLSRADLSGRIERFEVRIDKTVAAIADLSFDRGISPDNIDPQFFGYRQVSLIIIIFWF